MASNNTSRPARMPFIDAVNHIKLNAYKRNKDITDSLIAKKLNIPEAQFKDYYERNFLPENLFQILESGFAEFYTILAVTSVSYEEIPDPIDDENSEDRK